MFKSALVMLFGAVFYFVVSAFVANPDQSDLPRDTATQNQVGHQSFNAKR